MAKQLSKIGISSLGTIRPGHVSQSIDAFTGIEAYDISLSGSFNMTGSINVTGSITGSLFGTASFASSASQSISSSFATSASFTTSASFATSASTVPASGVIGLNLAQISTGSVTASVSPTQFTVVSGSVTKFTVTGTGVTLGSALTDTHSVTGSLRITGSQTLIGPLNVTGTLIVDNNAFTGPGLGIGTSTPDSPLNITRPISASGNIGRIVNITSTLTATADGNNLVAVDITPTFATSPFTGVNTIGLRVSAGSVSFQGGGLTSAGVLTVNNKVTAAARVTVGPGLTSDTNGAIYTTSGGSKNLEIVSDAAPGRGMIVFSGTGNIGIGTTTDAFFRLDVNGTARVQGNLTLSNGTAPSTSPTDAFQMYSADIVGGNAAPHFRTENGNIIKIYQETTGVASSTRAIGGGLTITTTDTFDGYTIAQVVKALRNLGILA